MLHSSWKVLSLNWNLCESSPSYLAPPTESSGFYILSTCSETQTRPWSHWNLFLVSCRNRWWASRAEHRQSRGHLAFRLIIQEINLVFDDLKVLENSPNSAGCVTPDEIIILANLMIINSPNQSVLYMDTHDLMFTQSRERSYIFALFYNSFFWWRNDAGWFLFCVVATGYFPVSCCDLHNGRMWPSVNDDAVEEAQTSALNPRRLQTIRQLLSLHFLFSVLGRGGGFFYVFLSVRFLQLT